MSHTGTIPVQGGELYYDDQGHGTPVVFLHAGIANLDMWDPQIEAFTSAGYRTVRYDLRGYGRSTSEDEAFSYHEDLRAVLDHLRIERMHLIGSSFGGRVCIDFALAYPERVLSLVPVCARPAGFPTVFTPAEINKVDELEAAEEGSNHDLTARLDVELFVDGVYREGLAAPEVREKVYQMTRANYDGQPPLTQSTPLTPAAYERLNQVTAPALVVIGLLDLQTMVKAADYLTEQLPRARRLEFATAAHLPSLELPDLFNREVLAFLKAV